MATLATQIRKQEQKRLPPFLNPRAIEMLSYAQNRLADRDTIRVNIQNVVDQRDIGDFEDIVPPFKTMWFEAVYTPSDKHRQFNWGALVERVTPSVTPGPESEHTIRVTMFENRGHVSIEQSKVFRCACDWVEPLGVVEVLADHIGQLMVDRDDGLYIGALPPLIALHDNEQEAARVANEKSVAFYMKALPIYTCLVLEAIVRMNTCGTVVCPPWPELKNLREKPNPRYPSSVWHTLHLGVPHIGDQQSASSSVCREAEDRREHWVRAHRKDYRQGPGLFGRIRKLIWVHEYKRGDHERGTVVPDFVIH